jgi:hypothetical protein
MIYVEQHLLDPKTRMPTGMCLVQFELIKDFNDFYVLAKTDPNTMINVLNYNPHTNPRQKDICDARLFSMSQENCT